METALEWYSDKLLEILGDNVNLFTKEQTLANHYALEQAKEMEKQQIKDAYDQGSEAGYELAKNDDFTEGYKTKEAEQYYNETFS